MAVFRFPVCLNSFKNREKAISDSPWQIMSQHPSSVKNFEWYSRGRQSTPPNNTGILGYLFLRYLPALMENSLLDMFTEKAIRFVEESEDDDPGQSDVSDPS